MYYRIKVAGLERDLPLCPITSDLNIGAFIMFGDVELTERCAADLIAKAPEHDVIITAESKGIPLAHEMAALRSMSYIASAAILPAMSDVISTLSFSLWLPRIDTPLFSFTTSLTLPHVVVPSAFSIAWSLFTLTFCFVSSLKYSA